MPPKRDDADSLRRRLEAGYERIDRAKQTGIDTRTWEQFWQNLLDEYEAVLNELEDPTHEDPDRHRTPRR